MNNWDHLKIFLGVVGVVSFLTLSAFLIVYLSWYLTEEAIKSGALIDGPSAWEYEALAQTEERDANHRIAIAWDLHRLYEPTSELGELRPLLFEQQDFASVEARLNERFSSIQGPMAFRMYSLAHDSLGAMGYDDNAETMQSILDTWVAEHPESSHARIVRGRFLLDRAWYYRGTGISHGIPQENKREFTRYAKLARTDLEEALEMNPRDPDAAALLVKVSMALKLKRSLMEKYYESALAANPLDLDARIHKFHYLLPRWKGSWEEADAFLLECDRDRVGFPLLGIIRRLADEEMRLRSDSYDVAYHASVTRSSWRQPYLEQLKQTPEYLFLQANAAYYALEAGDYGLATEYFEQVGNRFPVESEFHDVVEYSDHRARAYLGHAETLPLGQEVQWKERAVKAAPQSAVANCSYGEALCRQGDYAKAESFLQTATNIDPDCAPAYINLALLAETTRRPREASWYARQALNLPLNSEQEQTAQNILARNR